MSRRRSQVGGGVGKLSWVALQIVEEQLLQRGEEQFLQIVEEQLLKRGEEQFLQIGEEQLLNVL